MEDDADGRDRRGHARLGQRPDFTDSFGEAGGLAKYLARQQQNSRSVLIRDLAYVRGTGFGFTASREKAETQTLGRRH
jgi:hypothetical protein